MHTCCHTYQIRFARHPYAQYHMQKAGYLVYCPKLYIMKPIMLFIFFFLAIATTVDAQKVVYKDDIIYADDVPYAQMKKSGGIMPNFSVLTLDGKEILIVKFDKGEGGSMRYLATFTGSGMQVFMKNEIGFGKKLAKEVVENNLIKNGNLNPEGEKRFLLSNNTPYGESERNYGSQQAPVNINNGGMHKERDRNQAIYLQGQKLLQANMVIGTYQKSIISINGDLYNIYNIYTADGVKIAEAKTRQFNAGSCKLSTINDNKVTSINIDSDIEFEQIKQIATYLSDHFYL